MSEKNKDLRAKLDADALIGDWTEFAEQLERGSVFFIHPDLILSEVAYAIAVDETVKVEGWIGGGELARPSAEQIKRWNEFPGLKFRFIIVQPYVLIQELAH